MAADLSPIHAQAWEAMQEMCRAAAKVRTLRAEKLRVDYELTSAEAALRARITDCEALQVRMVALPVIDVQHGARQLWDPEMHARG